MDFLIHGVYDAQTLKCLHNLNVSHIGFDLRGKSLNLIPFHVLKSFLPNLNHQNYYLTFENDKLETIYSFLSLLDHHCHKFILEFRDNMQASFYQSVSHPFTWFFRPEGDWQNILKLTDLKAIILPVSLQSYYQNLPKFWHMIQERDLPVILHVDSFADLELYLQEKNLTLSVDLGKEMEIAFRQVDHSRLMNLQLWRMKYEVASGQ